MFVSGKDEDYAWDKAKVSEALNADQLAILDARGVLSPDEIHKLASKTKNPSPATTVKAASDYVDSDEAKRIQEEVTPA